MEMAAATHRENFFQKVISGLGTHPPIELEGAHGKMQSAVQYSGHVPKIYVTQAGKRPDSLWMCRSQQVVKTVI